MHVADLHPWDLSTSEARDLQERLAAQIDVESPLRLAPGDLVIGVDNSYLETAAMTTGFAAAVVMTWPDLDVVDLQTAQAPVSFPYVPGLLTFRELPVLLDAIRQVACQPALIFCDGHGIAHPRGIGIASHIGLMTDTPTIGVAKKPFRASWTQPGQDVGATTPMLIDETQVGFAVRTSGRRKHPVFVSPGHLIRLEDVVEPVLVTSRGNYLPAPQQAAHDEVTQLRKIAKETPAR